MRLVIEENRLELELSNENLLNDERFFKNLLELTQRNQPVRYTGATLLTKESVIEPLKESVPRKADVVDLTEMVNKRLEEGPLERRRLPNITESRGFACPHCLQSVFMNIGEGAYIKNVYSDLLADIYYINSNIALPNEAGITVKDYKALLETILNDLGSVELIEKINALDDVFGYCPVCGEHESIYDWAIMYKKNDGNVCPLCGDNLEKVKEEGSETFSKIKCEDKECGYEKTVQIKESEDKQ